MKLYGAGLGITQIITTASGNEGCIHPHYVVVFGPDLGGDIAAAYQEPLICAGVGSGTYYMHFGPNSNGLPFTLIRPGTAAAFWDGFGYDPTVYVHR